MPAVEDRPQWGVDRLQLEVPKGHVQRRDAASAQQTGEPPPLSRGTVLDLAELPEDVTLIGIQAEPQAAFPQLAAGAQVLESRAGVPEGHEHGRVVGQTKPFGQRPAHEPLRAAGRLARVRDGLADGPGRGSELPVINDQRPRRPGTVGVREDLFVHAALGREVVAQEIVDLGEPATPVEDGEQLQAVALQEPGIGLLVQGRPPELHPVFLAEALHLAVPEHRQSGQRGHDHGHAKVLVALAELLHGGLLVRVAHEVHVALEDLRVELQGFADQLSVARPILVAEHVHERAVVDAMHPQRPDEVALQHPERLGQEERAGHFRRHAIHHFTPELDRHPGVEVSLAHRMLGT